MSRFIFSTTQCNSEWDTTNVQSAEILQLLKQEAERKTTTLNKHTIMADHQVPDKNRTTAYKDHVYEIARTLLLCVI